MPRFSKQNIINVTCTGDIYGKSKTPVQFLWTIASFGFGTTTFTYDQNGTLKCDSETMSKAEIKKILCAFVDTAIFEDGPDAPKP